MSQNRKKQIAVWNRRLAWVTFPLFLISTITTYLYASYPTLKQTAGISSMIFVLCFFVHTIFGVYLFGFPKFKWQIRVVHIYLGYLLFVVTILSQGIIKAEPFYRISYISMIILVLAHVSLSFRFMLKRNVKKIEEPSLNFRGES
jgi:uncharacterized membrane protein